MEMRGVGCGVCGGTGFEDNITDEGVNGYISDGYAGKAASDIQSVRRRWKKTGQIPCWNCRGTGEVKMPMRERLP